MSSAFAQKTCQRLFEEEPLSYIERLIQIEDELSSLDKLANQLMTSASANPIEKEKVFIQMTSHHVIFDTLTEYLLNEEKGDYEVPTSQLQSALIKTKNQIHFLQRRFEVTSIVDLIENPQLLLAHKSYLVPQADSISGQPSSVKLSVTFSEETVHFLQQDLTAASRFMRALQKGYVPALSGSGIVRITDQHEDLLEVKVIGGREGNTRLIGCRGAAGAITLLKVYEKRNSGHGGSLKKFSMLCG